MTESFTYEDSELDFDNYALTGCWTLEIETNDGGLSFKLIDAESVRRGVDRETFALIQSWIDGDTAPRFPRAKHVSKVRAVYNDAMWQRDPVAEAAASRADDLRDMRRSA